MQHSFPPPRSTELSLLLAWSFALPNGTIESTPLVHDGTMFILAPSGRLQALDAATGGFIWEYRYETPSGDRPAPLPARSIALYGDAVLMPTPDEALVSIDARPRKQRCRAQNGDPTLVFHHMAGTLAAQSRVLPGLNGCERIDKEYSDLIVRDPERQKPERTTP